MNPKYPVYIVSKGRWYNPLTAKVLEQMGVPYRIVVEPSEHAHYAAVIDPAKILTLPFNNLGQGSIPARNWVWAHAVTEGHRRHWILDDNIRCFYRLHRNFKYYADTGTIFRAAEDFVDRYENIALAGLWYSMFAPKRKKLPPLAFNTRVYSCILIDNALPFRWRGTYNEDTDLSLRVLKAGYCTVLFYAFLAEKRATMRMRGGNTDTLYRGNGRWQMAHALAQQHPDVAAVVWKWNRWHHKVDYSRFKYNRLIRRPDVDIPDGICEYDMLFIRQDTVDQRSDAHDTASSCIT